MICNFDDNLAYFMLQLESSGKPFSQEIPFTAKSKFRF